MPRLSKSESRKESASKRNKIDVDCLGIKKNSKRTCDKNSLIIKNQAI